MFAFIYSDFSLVTDEQVSVSNPDHMWLDPVHRYVYPWHIVF